MVGNRPMPYVLAVVADVLCLDRPCRPGNVFTDVTPHFAKYTGKSGLDAGILSVAEQSNSLNH